MTGFVLDDYNVPLLPVQCGVGIPTNRNFFAMPVNGSVYCVDTAEGWSVKASCIGVPSDSYVSLRVCTMPGCTGTCSPYWAGATNSSRTRILIFIYKCRVFFLYLMSRACMCTWYRMYSDIAR